MRFKVVECSEEHITVFRVLDTKDGTYHCCSYCRAIGEVYCSFINQETAETYVHSVLNKKELEEVFNNKVKTYLDE